jgi:general secretion pathway protein L
MTKRRIGIEITPQCLRMAIFDDNRDTPVLLRKIEQPVNPDQELSEQINAMLDAPAGFGDRFCTALTSEGCFVRRLTFPFDDPRKIEAAAGMELAAQLPVDISDHIIATTPVVAEQDTYATMVATVPAEKIATALAPFEAIKLPLHVLGLSPFTEVNGLGNWFKQGILVRAHDGQLTLTLVQQGRVLSHENCGMIAEGDATLGDRILRESALLCRSERLEPQPLCLIGSHITTTLTTELAEQLEITDLSAVGGEQNLDNAFLPVCAMALAAEKPVINFRRGRFTLKSEWASLKKHFYIGGTLLLATIAILIGTALHSYQFKTGVAENYRKQINQVFRETLPGQTTIVDPVKQLEAELNRLRETGQLVGLDKSVSALSVLRDFSLHTPKDISVDIKNFNYEPEALTVEGITKSFDSVNRLASELRKSPSFSAVRIADAKMGLEGNKVTFRLQITIGHQGGAL